VLKGLHITARAFCCGDLPCLPAGRRAS